MASVLFSNTALRVHSETTKCQESYGDHVNLASAHLFPLNVLFCLADLEGWRSRQSLHGVAWEGIISAEPIRPDYTSWAISTTRAATTGQVAPFPEQRIPNETCACVWEIGRMPNCQYPAPPETDPSHSFFNGNKSSKLCRLFLRILYTYQCARKNDLGNNVQPVEFVAPRPSIATNIPPNGTELPRK